MYLEYWGLAEKPFVNTPNPKFLFETRQHAGALRQLEIAVEERLGAALLTGVVGSGKTMVAHALCDRLSPERYRSVILSHPQPDPLELLLSAAIALGEDSLPSAQSELLATTILSGIERRLLENARSGMDTLLVIDEAHLFEGLDTFEQLRLLLNFQLEDRPLLTLLLVGQPELQARVDRIGPFEQRIGMKCYLKGLSREESELYVVHRLRVAGREEPAFTPAALDLLFEFSEGIPRQINRLCALGLAEGSLEEAPVVDEALVWKQVRNLTSGEIPLPAREEMAAAGEVGPIAAAVPALPGSPVAASPPSPEEIGRGEASPPEEIARGEASPLDARHLYAHALVVTRGIFNRARNGDPIEPTVLVSLVERLAESIKEEEDPIMELFFRHGGRDYQYAHAVNVCILILKIGLSMELKHEELIRLGLCGLLHDVGLVKAVPIRHRTGTPAEWGGPGERLAGSLGLDEVIRQPRVLTDEEREELRRYPLYTREIVESIDGIDPLVAGILCQHHERFNGQGSPEGLEGKLIHPHAQLTALCCVYEALTHPRKHRGKRLPDEAMEVVTEQAGKHFDPDLVVDFVRRIGIYPVGWWVELSTGEVGRVTGLIPRAATRPIVEVMFDSGGKKLAEPKLVDLSRTPVDRVRRMIDVPAE